MYDLKGGKKLLFSAGRGQANFQGPGGFEAKVKAKDLPLEAKAKDFKNCPRGQGHPRGRRNGTKLWAQTRKCKLEPDVDLKL